MRSPIARHAVGELAADARRGRLASGPGDRRGLGRTGHVRGRRRHGRQTPARRCVRSSLVMHASFWLSIAKLNGGRFMDGYKPGFPLYLLYARPVPTAVFVGVAMAYDAISAAAMYLVSAALLRFAFGQPLPLFSVAAWIVAFHLVYLRPMVDPNRSFSGWDRCGSGTGPCICLTMSVGGPRIVADADRVLARRVRTDGLDWPRVVRPHGRRRSAAAPRRRVAAVPRTAGIGGYPDWLVTLFRFPCPTSSATRAQVWFELKSSGLPVLAIGLALAILIPLLFAISTRLDVALSGVFTRTAHPMSRCSWRCSPCRPCWSSEAMPSAFAGDKDARTPAHSRRPSRTAPRRWPASRCSCGRSACWPR